MKKLKVNLMMVLALFIGAVAMSFNLTNTSSIWHYEGSANPGVYTDADNWVIGSAPSGVCQSVGTQPCEISADATTKPELEEFFSDMDNEDVLELNESSRRD